MRKQLDYVRKLKYNVIKTAVSILFGTVLFCYSGNTVTTHAEVIGGANGTTFVEGQTNTYSYTGGVQVFTVPTSGLYKLEVWGAKGGRGDATGSGFDGAGGGGGGYSSGYISLNAGTPLYICVGGGGWGNRESQGSGTGYNGGGGGTCSDGGGATHIAINNNRGVLSNYSENQNEVLIVAGGGGGGASIYYDGSPHWLTGGSGGGENGSDGGDSWWDSESGREEGTSASGDGGTQTYGGRDGGGFGYGGNSSAGGAGGGGWYGGGGASNWNGCGSGAGGSGYIGGVPAITFKGTTYSPATSNGGRQGDGYAVITFIAYTDNEPPVISNITASVTAMTKNNITVTVAATDNVGVTGYSADNINWQTGNTFTITANGTYTYYAKDAVGNVSSKSITITNIDKTSPTISKVAASTTAQTNQNVTVTITASDNVGVTGYSANNVNWQTGNTFTVTANGTYTYYVKDAAGNVSSKSITISNIDKEKPVISKVEASTTAQTNQNVTITITATDNVGITGYSSDNTTWQNENTFIVTENGTYTYYVKDAAGNIATKTIVITNIDKEAPTGEIVYSASTWTNQDVTITANVTDNATSAERLLYSWDDADYSNNSTKVTSVNTEGNVKVKDEAGNILTLSYQVTIIDKEKPVINNSEYRHGLDLVEYQMDENGQNLSATFKIMATDNNPEPLTYSLTARNNGMIVDTSDNDTYTLNVTGTTEISYRVIDPAGNYAEESVIIHAPDCQLDVTCADTFIEEDIITFDYVTTDAQEVMFQMQQKGGKTVPDEDEWTELSIPILVNTETVDENNSGIVRKHIEAQVPVGTGDCWFRVYVPGQEDGFEFEKKDRIDSYFMVLTKLIVDRISISCPFDTVEAGDSVYISDLTVTGYYNLASKTPINLSTDIEKSQYLHFVDTESGELVTAICPVDVKEADTYTVRYSFEEEPVDKTITYRIQDTTPPEIVSYNYIQDWSYQDVLLTAKTTDNSSGKQYFALTYDSPLSVNEMLQLNGTANNLSGENEVTFPLTVNGTWYIQSCDEYGNLSTEEITVTNIDKDAPIINHIWIVSKNDSKISKVEKDSEIPSGTQFISFEIDATDTISGIRVYRYKSSTGDYSAWTKNNIVDGIYLNDTYTFQVMDICGNIRTQTLTVSALTQKFEVTYLDVNTNGNIMGERKIFKDLDASVSGAELGINPNTGAYYEGYDYISCDTAVVGTTGATVHRYFKLHTYEVNYHDASGTVISNSIVPHGTAASTTLVPVKESVESGQYIYIYTFTGWGDINGNLLDTSNITCDMDLYPVYAETEIFRDSPSNPGEQEETLLSDSTAEIDVTKLGQNVEYVSQVYEQNSSANVLPSESDQLPNSIILDSKAPSGLSRFINLYKDEETKPIAITTTAVAGVTLGITLASLLLHVLLGTGLIQTIIFGWFYFKKKIRFVQGAWLLSENMRYVDRYGRKVEATFDGRHYVFTRKGQLLNGVDVETLIERLNTGKITYKQFEEAISESEVYTAFSKDVQIEVQNVKAQNVNTGKAKGFNMAKSIHALVDEAGDYAVRIQNSGKEILFELKYADL